jgi:hypothetical protein
MRPKNLKTLILNIPSRWNIELGSNVSGKTGMSFVCSMERVADLMATCVETLIQGCGCSLEE